MGRGSWNPTSTIFVDLPFFLMYLTITTSPNHTSVSVNICFTFSQTYKLTYKPALLTSDPGHLSNYSQCASHNTRCLQGFPSLGGALIAACHPDKVSNSFNGRLNLLTAQIDKYSRRLPSVFNILPDSPVFRRKHMFPASTQNREEEEGAQWANLGGEAT